jgi:hypothetical protein
MSPNTPDERGGFKDRRRQDLPIWHPRRLHGRRRRNRRAEEDGRPYLVDRVGWASFLLATLLLVLTLVDGLLTVALLDHGCEEANPVMRLLLDRGVGTFLAGKYLLTAAFLPFVVVAYRYPLFGTRIRVGHVLPAVVALYLVLIAYQSALLARLDDVGPLPRPGVMPRAAAR